MDADLSFELRSPQGGVLRLANPVMAASGTFGYGTEYADTIDIQQLGAIVSKGITLKPRSGNPLPRLVETPAGLLNSIGLENIGLEALIREKAPIWQRWQVPVIANIAGENPGEYAEIAAALDGVPGISGIEVNISCPNMAAGGMEFGTDPTMVATVTSLVRERTRRPVIVKLTPNVTDVRTTARAAADAGADALTVANTFRAMAIDTSEQRPALGNISGGLSGPAIRPLALYQVYHVYREVDIPVIGCGGITSANDALEFIMAGASAVQVGSATFADPDAMLNIVRGIEEYMVSRRVHAISGLVGIANHGGRCA